MVVKIENDAAANIPTHGSSFSTYVVLILYTHKQLSKTEWMISNITLEAGFPDKIGLN